MLGRDGGVSERDEGLLRVGGGGGGEEEGEEAGEEVRVSGTLSAAATTTTCSDRLTSSRESGGNEEEATHRLLGEADAELALERADEELGLLALALCEERLDEADLARLRLWSTSTNSHQHAVSRTRDGPPRRRRNRATHVLAARLCHLLELVKHAADGERLALEERLLARARVERDLAEVANLLVLGLDLGERAPARLADRLHEERLADPELERLVLGRELRAINEIAAHQLCFVEEDERGPSDEDEGRTRLMHR